MEESKLNFNAPLLSVRRLSSTSFRDKHTIAENHPSTMGHIIPYVNTDVCLDMVTEPVAVPFVWERIPGKAKGGTELEFQPNKEADDVCSNALDTLSLTGSFSKNCSTNRSVAKPSGTFSAYPQQMSHFSPTAKVMTLKTPPYASRKQSMALEQSREVRDVAVGGRLPPVYHYESIIIPPHYGSSYNLSRTLCGLLPRLGFMNSMYLSKHVPGLKVRTRSSMPSSGEVAKPEIPTSIKSHSQIIDKNAWDIVCYNKSDSSVQSSRHQEKNSDSRTQSYRAPEICKNLSCGSNQFSSSNDLQMVNWLPFKRHPGSARISPYRREKPQSLFRGGGFLGMPKEAENFKAHMLDKDTGSSNLSQELVPYLSTKQGSHSLSSPVQKTLYVEPATASIEPSLQDIKDLSLLDRKCISENEITGSGNSSTSSLSDKPDLRGDSDQGEAKGSSGYPHFPLPLPRAPSESWLLRALPAIAARNSFSICFNPRKQEPKIVITDTKWETIVRTSYLHHDHVRYCKELGAYLSRQSKT